MEDIDEARALAGRLYERQGRWREAATSAWATVRNAFDRSADADGHSLVMVEAEIPIAVVGYVTSRLAEDTRRPAIVMTRRGEDVVAEARGPAGFNFVDGFATMRELFKGYGGHPRAAGFSMDPDNLQAFRTKMRAYVEENPPEPDPRSLDAELALRDVTAKLAEELELMRPFGQGSHRACFLARSVDSGELKKAESLGVRFGTPLMLPRASTDVVFRLRESNGVPLVSVVDTV
jgi:single-stranded-DNA-specific exonuclease